MKFLKIGAICLLLHMIYSFISNKSDTRDGMLCYIIEERNNNSIYTIFSGYGMRHSIESQVANELVYRYQNKLLNDTMSIYANKFRIFGYCNVDTITPPRLISFCAKQYIFSNGDIQLVKSEFCEK